MSRSSVSMRGYMSWSSVSVRGSMSGRPSTRRSPTAWCHVSGRSTCSRRSSNRTGCSTTRRGVPRGSAPGRGSPTRRRMSGSPASRCATSRGSSSLVRGCHSGCTSSWCSSTRGSCSRCLMSRCVPVVRGDSWGQDRRLVAWSPQGSAPAVN